MNTWRKSANVVVLLLACCMPEWKCDASERIRVAELTSTTNELKVEGTEVNKASQQSSGKEREAVQQAKTALQSVLKKNTELKAELTKERSRNVEELKSCVQQLGDTSAKMGAGVQKLGNSVQQFTNTADSTVAKIGEAMGRTEACAAQLSEITNQNKKLLDQQTKNNEDLREIKDQYAMMFEMHKQFFEKNGQPPALTNQGNANAPKQLSQRDRPKALDYNGRNQGQNTPQGTCTKKRIIVETPSDDSNTTETNSKINSTCSSIYPTGKSGNGDGQNCQNNRIVCRLNDGHRNRGTFGYPLKTPLKKIDPPCDNKPRIWTVQITDDDSYQKIKKLKDMVQELTEELDSPKKEIANKDRTIEKQEQRYTELQETNTLQYKELQELKLTNWRLKQMCFQKDEEAKNARRQMVCDLKNVQYSFRTKLEKLQAARKREKAELESKLTEEIKTVMNLRSNLKDKENEIAGLKDDIERLQLKIKEQAQEARNSEETLQRKSEELQSLQRQLQRERDQHDYLYNLQKSFSNKKSPKDNSDGLKFIGEPGYSS